MSNTDGYTLVEEEILGGRKVILWADGPDRWAIERRWRDADDRWITLQSEKSARECFEANIRVLERKAGVTRAESERRRHEDRPNFGRF